MSLLSGFFSIHFKTWILSISLFCLVLFCTHIHHSQHIAFHQSLPHFQIHIDIKFCLFFILFFYPWQRITLHPQSSVSIFPKNLNFSTCTFLSLVMIVIFWMLLFLITFVFIIFIFIPYSLHLLPTSLKCFVKLYCYYLILQCHQQSNIDYVFSLYYSVNMSSIQKFKGIITDYKFVSFLYLLLCSLLVFHVLLADFCFVYNFLIKPSVFPTQRKAWWRDK